MIAAPHSADVVPHTPTITSAKSFTWAPNSGEKHKPHYLEIIEPAGSFRVTSTSDYLLQTFHEAQDRYEPVRITVRERVGLALTRGKAMRKGLLVGLTAILLGAVGYNYWKSVSERAAEQREAQWSQPFSAAYAAYEQRRYVDSEAMVTALLSQNPNANASQMTNALMLLGSVTLMQHRNAEAEAYLRKAVVLRKQDRKTQEIDLAISLSRLAEALRDQGKYNEAIQVFQEALSIYQKSPAAYGKHFAMCLLELGIITHDEHKWDEAERYLMQATSAFQRYLGPNESDTADAIFRLAELRFDQRHFAEAEAGYRKAFSIQEVAFGPESADVAETLEELAAACKAQGRRLEAKRISARANAIFAKASPSEAVPEGTILYERAQFLDGESQHPEAAALYKQAISSYEKQFGHNHPYVASSLVRLALLYRDEKEFALDSAEPLFQDSLSIQEHVFGPESAEPAMTLSNLSLLYFYEKRSTEAKAFAQRALVIQEKALGPDDLDVALTLNRLGIAQRDLGNLSEAETALKRALAIRERKLSPDHPFLTISLDNLASVYVEEGHLKEAQSLLGRSALIRSKNHGPDAL